MNDLTAQEQLVYDLLPRGIENSRTYKQLNLNIDKRAFFQVINSLRLKGKVIGAIRGKTGGYYVATTEVERNMALRQFEAQMMNEMKIIAAIRKADLEEV